MSVLERIKNQNDIKALSVFELYELAGEIREFLIENISKTGGHLASNLGIVELTLAIHKVFDTSVDRLVFDVGHQSYVHKILTGRKNDFTHLRKFGGISGFTRPAENEHDACVSGHASNSVSVALGMARARTLTNKEHSVLALIGDGAFTGGMAYEALSDAGQSSEPLIVILNDNEMSITKNVGAMTNYLAKLRVKKKYLRFKNVYRRIIKKSKITIAIDNGIHKAKRAIKNAFIPSLFFEEMGFTYLGPADGHDIKYVIYLLELARDLKRPVVIHLTTTKGKGYMPSEERPEKYHGVGKFDVETGVSVSGKNETFSDIFGQELASLAEKNEKICAITAAMTSGVGLTSFAEQFPDRFFDVAIAEEHAVAMAAGLSAQGMVPVCAIYSTFLQRAYDMLIHDVAISKQHVVFAVDRAGLVGEDGETHHGVFDVAYLSSIPGLKILAPSNFSELRAMLKYSVETDGPVAIRYPRGAEGDFKENTFDNTSAKLICEGSDVCVVTYGTLVNNVLSASKRLESDGLRASVLKLNSLKPLDDEIISDIASRHKSVIVVEEVVEKGSVFEQISAMCSKNNINCKLIPVNTGDSFTTHGELDKLYNVLNLSEEGIYKTVLEAFKV